MHICIYVLFKQLYSFSCYIWVFGPYYVNFVYGLRFGGGSNFILLHVDIQLFQQHRLKKLSFFPLNCLDTLDKNKLTITV